MIYSSKFKNIHKLALAISFIKTSESFGMGNEERTNPQHRPTCRFIFGAAIGNVVSAGQIYQPRLEQHRSQQSNITLGFFFNPFNSPERRVDVTEQEALSQDKNAIKTNFSKSILPKIINLVPDKTDAENLLPRTLKEVEFSLMELLKDQSIKGDERFKLEKALRSLDTFYGNGNYLSFESYKTKDYIDYSYQGMPNTMQLFITLIKLCGDKNYEQMFELVVQEKYGIQKSKTKEDNKNKFLESQLKKHKINPEILEDHLDPRGYAILNAKNSNPSNFEQFKLALSEKFEENGIKLGSTLTDTTDRYPDFYKVLFKMMNNEHSPILIGLKKSLNEAVKDKLNPITEVLFMLSRGHNTELLKYESDNATDRPSCPDGVYLRLIKEIMLIVGDSDPASLAMLSKLEQEVRCERVN